MNLPDDGTILGPVGMGADDVELAEADTVLLAEAEVVSLYIWIRTLPPQKVVGSPPQT